MKRIRTHLVSVLGLFAAGSLAQAEPLNVEHDAKEEWAKEASAEWKRQYNQAKREREYAASVSDEMLAHVLLASWRSAKRLACVTTDLALDPPSGYDADPFSDWINEHLTASEEAAQVFDYDPILVEFDMLNEIRREHAARTLEEVLRPAFRAYARAKHEEALRVLSINQTYLGERTGGVHFCREFISSS